MNTPIMAFRLPPDVAETVKTYSKLYDVTYTEAICRMVREWQEDSRKRGEQWMDRFTTVGLNQHSDT